MFEKRVGDLELPTQIPLCFVKHAGVKGEKLLRTVLLKCVEIVKQSCY